jgi:hypothetical protein
MTPIECQADIVAALPAHLAQFARFPGCGHAVVPDAPEAALAKIRQLYGRSRWASRQRTDGAARDCAGLPRRGTVRAAGAPRARRLDDGRKRGVAGWRESALSG